VGGIGRWGEGHSLDFWTALERGEVDDAEIRAVDLLRRTTDPFRFAYYCQTAMLPAMGNVTGRIYMLERGGSALELEDSRIVASWCISIGPHNERIPGTDQVVVLRNYVEGEEIEFMRIGNRITWYRPYEEVVFGRCGSDDWLPNLFFEPLGEEAETENEDILALEEVRPERRQYPIYVANPQPLQGVVDVEAGVRGAVRQAVGAYLNRQQDPAQQYELGEAIEEMVDVHGPGIGEEIAAAIEQEEGFADIHWFPEGELYEPVGPVLRQIPGRRMEAFLPVPMALGLNHAVMRQMPDGRWNYL
jgi:hypothetical protein